MGKVLLVAHWDWVLYNFRLPLAKALREHGYDVTFVCPFGEYVDKLMAEGFRCIHWSVIRRSVNPIREIKALLHLAHIYYRERPELVHHFTVKPNLLGSLAARLVARRKQGVRLKVINTFMGLGFLFSEDPIARLLRTATLPIFRLGQNAPAVWTVCLNFEDMERLTQFRLAIPSRTFVIVSDGVDIHKFSPNGQSDTSHREHTPIVLMAARLLWDKGVKEFVEVAQLLKERNVNAEFWLAGKPDDGNPMAVPEELLRSWHEQGVIKWLGHCDNMPELLRQVDIAVLPSYHEGVPRFLLEAAATGLPLVATDIEGCRMVVRDRLNGYLVPTRNAKALADAIEQLVRNPELRMRMGKASRGIAVKEFDERKILKQWLDLYEKILRERISP
ncbi:MAG: glycosyltransferase family 4 protein [Armatimonadota bacterium]